MFLLKANNQGFTMVELLVVLVILGLLAASVVPALDTWLRSRQSALIEEELVAQFASLPLKASRSGKDIVINNADDLNLASAAVKTAEPIYVLRNGFCLGGEIDVDLDGRSIKYIVQSPYCELVRVPSS